MAAPLLHTRLPGDAAASAAAVKTLGASRTGLSDMLALENDFFNSPPRKTVRFGGTVTEVLLKYRKDDQIINWLLEFRSSIMYLTKDFEQLINILLRLRWLNRSQTVVEEYLAFLGNLVSAQTVFLRPCLSMIASHFVPPRVVTKEGDIDVSDSDDEDDNLPANFDTCHRALQIIARYVPSTPWFLMPILVEKFPFVRKSERTLECYVHNLLRISVYFPTLRHEILELVIEKLLKLDVNASRQDIEDAEETATQTSSGTDATEGLFNMDEDEETDRETKADPGMLDQMVHPVAERLDILLSLLLSYIKDVCYVDGKLDNNKTKDLYRDLITIFDKLLLPTHASCHVQFFMFYLCSFKLGFAEAFLEHLWKKLQDPNNPAIIRQAAANYIGSFLARAKFVPLITVKSCLDLLVKWLHVYLNNQDSGTKAFCDVALHGPFYSACQAVFYTFVFRHRQLLSGNLKEGLRYLQSLNFERIVMSQLNPLKICLPSVVNFFAAITNKYQLVFCYTLIERNNRQMLPVIRNTAGGDSVQTCTNPLDTFFPFDPCVLKRSKKFIDPLYQVWEDMSAEELQEFKKPIKKEVVEDEEDDFLKGEAGITPSSFDAHFRSPSSSVGSPPVLYLPDQSPTITRICD
ncbi:RNA polymerase I-specific transcription initiation factor RRN3 isoform X3 [Neophocaena asiaeorientalis asiaeorientalis]|uniref:RNA polymerase I-specific transcription initiation factor RRN3 isoform X3 n=1 Tax=Neophocaena asiaeorientalis asiaeorientalis TaxID=1706337 RepID=A0A341BCF6_NEOAA|nr:RNA polymerase I-specific transcription initiation factor RRN3 isoform X3 [Neophocaena asiaeorientalis asiaeorientalis]XP_032462163.1 RNA polymerase I-specific transcription initiation factor RRN3 isoform X3 [Phocoena sinus]